MSAFKENHLIWRSNKSANILRSSITWIKVYCLLVEIKLYDIEEAATEMDIDGLSWLLEPLTDVPQLRRLWAELEKQSDCAFFLTWDWIGTWLSTTSDLSPVLLSVYDGPNVVALALFQPTKIRRRIGSAQALMLHRSGNPSDDLITIEYNGILSNRLYTDRIEGSIFSFLIKARNSNCGGRSWQEIHIGLATTDTIAERAKTSGLIITEAFRKPSWFVNLASIRAKGKQYLDTLSANTRYQIHRAVRMYQALGPINARAAKSAEEALDFFEELKQLHQTTWSQRGLSHSFASSHFEDFHRALLGQCIEQGSAEIIRVTAGNHLIGQV